MAEQTIDVARAIRFERYGGAGVVFAAGSIVRGEGTPFSDPDLVVVYARLPHAYRESFRFGGYPVEAFVHDAETLEYFFTSVDGPSGIPSLAQMVVEGVEIPEPTDFSRTLKQRAAGLIAAGPPPLDNDSERRMRYFVTDLLDDLRAPRSRAEMLGTGARLFEDLADYYLRRRGMWSAKGKAIPRALERADASLGAEYCGAFDGLFAGDDPSKVIRLAEEILRDSGGPLFEGFRLDAPEAWRRPKDAD